MNRFAAETAFQKKYGRPPALVTRAPGRVNLIGEHTDYNEGWVLPAAIDFALWTAVAPRADRTLRVFSGNKNEEVLLDLEKLGPPLKRHWSNYVLGMAAELPCDGHQLRGADLWFGGDVPEGAGLSSSAALEMSVGLALLANSGLILDRLQLALAGQRAEHHFAGTQCGIMDQFVSAHGKAHHAMLLDCRTLEFQFLPIPNLLRIVVCDTQVQHQLVSGEYNARRSQCEEGVRRLRAGLPNIRSLRDVTCAQLEQFAHLLPDPVRRRCRHVVGENERVCRFARALREEDYSGLGDLMAASHRSLRDDYEVSCPELDVMVRLALKAPGIVGARMTGGGFGGCTVNLVEASRVNDFQGAVASGYQSATGKSSRIWVTAASDGAAVVPP